MLSMRRQMLDELLFKFELDFVGDLLDVGGENINQRGRFRFNGAQNGKYKRVVLNIDASTQPDWVGDASKIPSQDETFQTLTCLEVLEHVERPDVVAAELSRVLKPGGKLYLSVPWMVGIHGDPYDFHRFTPQTISNLFHPGGLVVEDTITMGNGFDTIIDFIRAYVYGPQGSRVAKRLILITLKTVSLIPRTRRTQRKGCSSISTGYFFVLVKKHGGSP